MRLANFAPSSVSSRKKLLDCYIYGGTSTTKVEEDGLKWVSSRIEGTWPFSLGLE